MDKENKNPNVPNLRFSDYNDSLKNICLSELLSFQNGINADSDKYGKGIKYISVGDIINNDYITYDCIKGKVDISQKELNNYLVENGDILFQRSSETFEDIGNANVYLDEQPCTFGGFVIRGKKIGEYDPKYLNYLLKSPNARKQVIRLGAGAQHYNINQESLNKIILSFPSAKEQEKISQFLTKIEEQIQLQNKIIEDYKKLKKQIIDSIFSTTDTSWAKCSFKDIFKERKELHINDGTIVHATLSKEGIYPKTDRYDRDFLVKDEDKKYKVSYLNDICYNPANLKFGVITRNDYGKCIVSPIYVTYFVNPSYNPKFIELFVTRAAFLKEIRRYEQGTVYERMAVSSDDFLTYETRLPNVEIQNDIVESIDILDKKITQEQKYLELLAKQKDYLLSNMFI